METTATADTMFAGKSDAFVKWSMQQATRRMNTARGPSAAQAAERSANRARAEMNRRNAEGGRA